MDESIDDFIQMQLGTGKEQYDSFYDFRSQELDLALKQLLSWPCYDQFMNVDREVA